MKQMQAFSGSFFLCLCLLIHFPLRAESFREEDYAEWKKAINEAIEFIDLFTVKNAGVAQGENTTSANKTSATEYVSFAKICRQVQKKILYSRFLYSRQFPDEHRKCLLDLFRATRRLRQATPVRTVRVFPKTGKKKAPPVSPSEGLSLPSK